MTYSLISLSFNKLACTRRCLSALLTDTVTDVPWELIVVDNGSTDGSAAWCDTELVALGAAGMWAAIFADVGVMVLAVLNAIRALRE